MKTALKILFFITIPVWAIPAVFISVIFAGYADFSEFVDKILKEKNGG